jgi:hypothetical protein
METIVEMVILIFVVIGLSLTISAIANNRKRKNEERLFSAFSQLGTDNNLSFTSQELLGNRLIGLDGLKRKLLFIEAKDGKYNSLIIDIDKTKSCIVKRKYMPFNFGGKRLSPEEYLEKICLQCEGTDNSVVEVAFYVFHNDDISDRTALEQKAKDWEAILSKMIIKEHTKIA